MNQNPDIVTLMQKAESGDAESQFQVSMYHFSEGDY